MHRHDSNETTTAQNSSTTLLRSHRTIRMRQLPHKTAPLLCCAGTEQCIDMIRMRQLPSSTTLLRSHRTMHRHDSNETTTAQNSTTTLAATEQCIDMIRMRQLPHKTTKQLHYSVAQPPWSTNAPHITEREQTNERRRRAHRRTRSQSSPAAQHKQITRNTMMAQMPPALSSPVTLSSTCSPLCSLRPNASNAMDICCTWEPSKGSSSESDFRASTTRAAGFSICSHSLRQHENTRIAHTNKQTNTHTHTHTHTFPRSTSQPSSAAMAMTNVRSPKKEPELR
jgi:hypothetical protein